MRLGYWEWSSGRSHWVSVKSITLLNTLTPHTYIFLTPAPWGLKQNTNDGEKHGAKFSLKPQRGLHSTFHPFYSPVISPLVLLAQTLINYRVGGREKSAWEQWSRLKFWFIQLWMILKFNFLLLKVTCCFFQAIWYPSVLILNSLPFVLYGVESNHYFKTEFRICWLTSPQPQGMERNNISHAEMLMS